MKRDWDSIRGAYLQSNLSLRDLAVKEGISFSTLGKKAVREQWAQRRERLGNDVATRVETSALQAAEEQGREIGLTAASLIARTVAETETWLNRVETTAASEGKMNPDALQKLVNSWRSVVETGRTAFGLGDKDKQPSVRISVMANAVSITEEQAKHAIDVSVPALPAPTDDDDGTGAPTAAA